MTQLQSPIYLDYNASTPVDPRVIEQMRPYFESHFGNPSSSHVYGQQTRHAVDRARQQVATMLGCHASEILFTSGGTESNNTVIKGVAEQCRDKGNHIIISAFEHPAIDAPCQYLEAQGMRVTRVGIDSSGRINLGQLREAFDAQTILVSVMHANNEVGVLQPIEEIAKMARERNVLCHTDASQSIGKVPVHVQSLGIDFLTIAGHKLYAPKGVGALFMRQGTQLPPLLHGAGHESGRRAGTENVLEIVGLGAAAELVTQELHTELPRIHELRGQLWRLLSQALPGLVLHGHATERLPNTLHIHFPKAPSQSLLALLHPHVATSAGSACHAHDETPSGTLHAMGILATQANQSLRLSLGRFTTHAEIEGAAQAIIQAVQQLQQTASPEGFSAP